MTMTSWIILGTLAFDKYKGTQKHQRIFTTRGTKQVKVIVSDGIDKTEQMINVNVV